MLRLLNSRAVAAAFVGLAAGAGGGFVLGDAIGGSFPGPAAKAAALHRLASVATTDSNRAPAPAPDTTPRPIPAQMLGDDVPVPVAPSVLRVRNGWLVSDGETLLAVYAGAAGDEPSVGRVVIVRQDLAAGKQTVRIIDAGSTGGLAIATAPLGRAVETSAQKGTLRLRTAGGGLLTVDLGSERVSHDVHTARLP